MTCSGSDAGLGSWSRRRLATAAEGGRACCARASKGWGRGQALLRWLREKTQREINRSPVLRCPNVREQLCRPSSIPGRPTTDVSSGRIQRSVGSWNFRSGTLATQKKPNLPKQQNQIFSAPIYHLSNSVRLTFYSHPVPIAGAGGYCWSGVREKHCWLLLEWCERNTLLADTGEQLFSFPMRPLQFFF